MWPIQLNMSRDECKKCLRCLELEAYGSMVSVLRAQGSFTNEKRKLLHELAKVLHISNERHRAEIRRAVSDEKLSTIAEKLNSTNTSADWAIEGRRTIPLLPRLNARNIFTSLANSLAMATSVANAKKVSIPCRNTTDVKAEPDTIIERLEEQELCVNTTMTQPESYSVNRKRKSRSENSDSSKNQSNQLNYPIKDTILSPLYTRLRSPPPPSGHSPNKVPKISTNSIASQHRDDIIEKTAGVNSALISRKVHQPSKSSCSGPNMTVPFKTVICQNAGHSQAPVQISRSAQMLVPAYIRTTASSKVQQKLVSAQNRARLTSTATTISEANASNTMIENKHPGISDAQISSNGERKSVKQVPTSCSVPVITKPRTSVSTVCTETMVSTTRHGVLPIVAGNPAFSHASAKLITINSGSIFSSGADPLYIRPTTAALTSQKNATANSSHQNDEMEVSSKVIIDEKNLCSTDQQTTDYVALLPHEISTNDEQNVEIVSSLPESESCENNAEVEGMIVFDLELDCLAESRGFSESSDASVILNSDGTPVTVNSISLPSTKEGSSHIQSSNCPVSTSVFIDAGPIIEFAVESTEHKEMSGPPEDVESEKVDFIDESSSMEIAHEILDNCEHICEIRETLDPETGLCSCPISDHAVNIIREEEAMGGTEINMFSTSLALANINLENFNYIDDNDSLNSLIDGKSKCLDIDQIDDSCDDHQSISDKSNSQLPR